MLQSCCQGQMRQWTKKAAQSYAGFPCSFWPLLLLLIDLSRSAYLDAVSSIFQGLWCAKHDSAPNSVPGRMLLVTKNRTFTTIWLQSWGELIGSRNWEWRAGALGAVQLEVQFKFTAVPPAPSSSWTSSILGLASPVAVRWLQVERTL